MEWAILLLLVPAIVIPVVLLFGFAGCNFSAHLTTSASPLLPPVITSATPLDDRTIRLSWMNPNQDAVRFDILRTPEGPGPPPSDDQQSPFFDRQLDSGATYSYRVRAIRISDGEPSEYSDVATAVTWAEAFNAKLETVGQNVDASGDCVVQRLDPPSLMRGGNLIVIVGQTASNGDLIVTRVTISDPSTSTGADPFDSGNEPTVIQGPFFGTAGQSIPLPPTSYTVNPGARLLIAFDIASPGNIRTASSPSCTAFTKGGSPQQPVTEAAIKDRSGFTARPNQVWFITRIIVATEWPTS